ncbi:MAG: flagellar M-ring protein FliF, partial [Clostridiales bacterium]|nr:flagellar M-ring protein FliF [Clostridiales bacterium]
MRKIIDSILKTLSGFWAKLARKDKIRLAVLAGVIVALSIIVTAVLGRTTYGTLYTGLDAAKAGEIIAELDSMGIAYKTEGTSTILVPEEDVTRTRMQLAAMGYGVSDGFSYDLYSLAEGFGKTDLEKQAALLWQTEYNVREQLLTMEKIQNCLVKIYLPDTSSFVLNSNDDVASASVTLVLKSGAALSNDDVNAIAHIVSGGTSVPVENISIVDNTAKLYTVGDGDASSAIALSDQLDLEARVRSDLESQVIALLTPVFGDGKVLASVGVTLNFDDESI